QFFDALLRGHLSISRVDAEHPIAPLLTTSCQQIAWAATASIGRVINAWWVGYELTRQRHTGISGITFSANNLRLPVARACGMGPDEKDLIAPPTPMA